MQYSPMKWVRHLKMGNHRLPGLVVLLICLGVTSSNIRAGEDSVPTEEPGTPLEVRAAQAPGSQAPGSQAPGSRAEVPQAPVSPAAASSAPAPAHKPARPRACPRGGLAGPPGKRQVVLLVAPGTHQSSALPQLAGPARDVARLRAALTHAGPGSVPAQNFCVLTDEEATLRNFFEVWEKDILARVSPGDSVLLYLSGIGSHTRDLEGDEPDEHDETFLMYGSRHEGQPDLSDDLLADMLRKLHPKVLEVTLILDTSGAGVAVPPGIPARSVPPVVQETTNNQAPVPGQAELGDGMRGWGARDLPGLVVLSAADHGTLALGDSQGGLFTSALLETLATPDMPTARAMLPELQRRLAAHGQLPSVAGALDRRLLRFLPDAWSSTGTVTQVAGNTLTLRHPGLFGWGPGAELLVLPADSSAARPQDAEPLATALITWGRGQVLSASLVPRPAAERGPRVGDRVQLFRPATEDARLVVAPVPAGIEGAVDPQTLKQLARALAGAPELARIVHLADSGASLSLRQRSDQALELVGPEGRVRVAIPAGTSQDSILLDTLRGFANQRALLLAAASIEAVPDELLTLHLRPTTDNTACRGELTSPAADSTLAARPQCGAEVGFGLAATASGPRSGLLLVLEPDGRIRSHPRPGWPLTLDPGPVQVLDLGTLPGQAVGAIGQILFLSAPKDDPVYWSNQGQDAVLPGPREISLNAQLWQFLRGQREDAWQHRGGALRQVSGAALLSWRGVRLPPTTGPQPLTNLSGFPLAGLREGVSLEALPQRPTSPALQRLFTELEALTKQAQKLGHHDWLQPTEEANLALGIDNPRALWHLFRRSGVPYNGGDRYLTTSGMTGDDSELSREFVRCDASPELHAGDLLVWRDGRRGIGQAALVIDPLERLVWGGLELDGTREEERTDQPALGYFSLRYRQDWDTLGFPGMQRVACWRHRQFMDGRP